MTPRMGGYVPADHKTRHQDGGRDEISIASLDGESVNLAAHKLVLDAHTKDIREILRTGEYHSCPHTTGIDTTLVAGSLYATPLFVARAITVDRIAIQVITGAAAGKKLRLGIYNNGTNVSPGTLLLDAGEVAADAVALAAITISKALSKGLYWVACITDGTPHIWGHNGSYLANNMLGLAPAHIYAHYTNWAVAQAYGALPDPFTGGATLLEATAPIIPVRIASLDWWADIKGNAVQSIGVRVASLTWKGVYTFNYNVKYFNGES